MEQKWKLSTIINVSYFSLRCKKRERVGERERFDKNSHNVPTKKKKFHFFIWKLKDTIERMERPSRSRPEPKAPQNSPHHSEDAGFIPPIPHLTRNYWSLYCSVYNFQLMWFLISCDLLLKWFNHFWDNLFFNLITICFYPITSFKNFARY